MIALIEDISDILGGMAQVIFYIDLFNLRRFSLRLK